MSGEHKFFVIFEPWTDEVAFVYRDFRMGQTVAGEGFSEDGHMLCRVLERGESSRRPTFRLPREMAQMLADGLKAAGIVPSDQPKDDAPAVKAHLQDAMAIRDRLLVLVEKR